jgi:hypothetical protein
MKKKLVDTKPKNIEDKKEVKPLILEEDIIHFQTKFIKNQKDHFTLIEIAKTSVLFIGLTNTWLIIWYYITKALSVLFTGKRNEVNEIESNNYVYFVSKGVVFIGFVYSLMPVFEDVLRIFFPIIEIPYYR